MRRQKVAFLVVAILLFGLIGIVEAGMVRVAFNGWTQNFSDPANRRMCLFLQVYFLPELHPPNYVKTITITAPDGSILSMNGSKDWLINDEAFYKAFYAADFKSGAIPSGTYTVKVVDTYGTSITETDSISASYMSVPTVTYPTNSATGVPEKPTLTWNAVSGATYYRVLLWNSSWDEPVYWYYIAKNNLQTDLTSVSIPKGVLKPNLNYRLRIQARSASQDVDRRSESDWINFTTGSW
jgi:hypothetical protein